MTNQTLVPQNLLQKYPAGNWTGSVACVLLDDYIFLIKRSESVPSHKGQVAMPGGHREEGENDPQVTAAREFEEETFISRKHLQFKGYLPFTVTNRKTVIASAVFKFTESMDYFSRQLSENKEWSDAFLVNIAELLEPHSWSYARRIDQTQKRALFFRELTPSEIIRLRGDEQRYLLWGATAKIIWSLLAHYEY